MEMRRWDLLVIAATTAAMLMGCNSDSLIDDDVKVLHIGGKVLCQDCSKGWNEWVHGASPLKGCKVAVTCMDKRRRVVLHAVDETDEQGAFNLIVNRYIHGKVLSEDGCLVRLISSPQKNCNVPTDFAGGKSGVTLRRPSLVYRDLVEYTLGPFYFTSPMCDEPDTKPEGGR